MLSTAHDSVVEISLCLFVIACFQFVSLNKKYVGPPYCRAEMYAGCVACCPLVSHGEYALSAL